MKFLNSNYVLCIGAHPDDVEYGMAGTFEKCYETEFTVMVMSSGGDFDNTTSETDRKSENEKIWTMFENVDGVVYDKFVKSQAEDEMVNFIENSIYKNFNCIVTTPNEDSHFEHRMINNLGPALCRRSPITLVEYRTPSTLNHWIPNYFMELTDNEYRHKKLALSRFKSQQRAPYFSEKSIDSFHHNFLCSKKGLEVVESYRIVENFQV